MLSDATSALLLLSGAAAPALQGPASKPYCVKQLFLRTSVYLVFKCESCLSCVWLCSLKICLRSHEARSAAPDVNLFAHVCLRRNYASRRMCTSAGSAQPLLPSALQT